MLSELTIPGSGTLPAGEQRQALHPRTLSRLHAGVVKHDGLSGQSARPDVFVEGVVRPNEAHAVSIRVRASKARMEIL